MDYITVREAAEKWHLAERTVQQLCRDGRIEGGRKFGGTWAIPAQAARPTDSRRDGGRGPSKRPAPIALRRAVSVLRFPAFCGIVYSYCRDRVPVVPTFYIQA